MAPPKIPPEVVKMLRDAFTKTMKDPDFLAETKKKRLDMDPTTGEEVQALATEVMSQPKDVMDRLKKCDGPARARQFLSFYGLISCINHSLGISWPMPFSLAAL